MAQEVAVRYPELPVGVVEELTVTWNEMIRSLEYRDSLASSTFLSSLGNPVESINDLSDVDTVTSAPSSGEFLTWDGTNWVPGSPITPSNALDDLTDVTITTLADNNFLQYDSGTSQWVNVVPPTHSIDDLTDVDTATATPSTGDLLKWDGTDWVPLDPDGAWPIDNLSDVDTTTVTPSSGDRLEWDGLGWVPLPPSSQPGRAVAFGELSGTVTLVNGFNCTRTLISAGIVQINFTTSVSTPYTVLVTLNEVGRSGFEVYTSLETSTDFRINTTTGPAGSPAYSILSFTVMKA